MDTPHEKTAEQYMATLAEYYATYKAAVEAMERAPRPEVCRILASQNPKGYFVVKL